MDVNNDEGSQAVVFGKTIRNEYFNFAADYRPLNHGSFGTIPKPVMQYQRAIQLQTEQKPDTFLRYTYPKLLSQSRAAIAPLIGADKDEVVFIPNASTGINTVLRNLQFDDGDVALYFNTIYASCLKTLQSLGESTPLKSHCIGLKYPLEDGEIVRLFEDAVQSVRSQGRNARLAVFDTVSTFPGVRFPWESLVDICRQMGILSFVDGAHGVGQIDLTHLGSLKPDFMISNCYKWLMVPRGCALLYVPFANQHLIKTTFPTSTGYKPPQTRASMKIPDYFVGLFNKVSTTDTSPYVCVPTALKFRQEVCGGEDKIRENCERIAREGGTHMANVLGTKTLDNRSQTLTRCSFTNVRLPLSLIELDATPSEGLKIAKWIQEQLPEDYETYLPTKFFQGEFWCRLSGQIYLTLEDFDWAAKILQELCKRAKTGEWREKIQERC